jgi:hypothetical protein
MSIKQDDVEDIRHWEGFRFKNGDTPFIEVWPEDEFADWISTHANEDRNKVCKTQEFRATPCCAVGYL